MKMNIICWNVAGIRARIKKKHMDFLAESKYDIVCLQETKALEAEVDMPASLGEAYPYRFWKSCTGEDQRKGLSGTAIWSKHQPVRELPPFPLGASEGRTVCIEYDDFIIVTVYTPNSQGRWTERNLYREQLWDSAFKSWVEQLNMTKHTIVCGDFNVANEKIDIHRPVEWSGCAGWLHGERSNFKRLLIAGWTDAFRYKYPEKTSAYTFWNQKCPWERKSNVGWRIDYFLVPRKKKYWIIDSQILDKTIGSDHCPITLQINTNRKRLLLDGA